MAGGLPNQDGTGEKVSVKDEARVRRKGRVGSGSAVIGRMSRVRSRASIAKAVAAAAVSSALEMSKMCGCGGGRLYAPHGASLGGGLWTGYSHKGPRFGSCMAGMRAS